LEILQLMRLILALVVAVAYLASAQQHCDTPPTWQANLVYTDPARGWAINAKHSQDGAGERVSIYEEVNDYHEQKREFLHKIWHYQTGYEYRIDLQKKNCTYYKHQYDFRPVHIPEHAKFVTDMYIGSSALIGGSVEVSYWTDMYFTPNIGHWEGEFTLFGCVPVREWYEDDDIGIIHNGWYNVVLGIADPDIFTPPELSTCKEGSGPASYPPYAAARLK